MPNARPSLIVVEDEPLIVMMVEDVVHDLGWTVAGSASTECDAFELLEICSPTLALLDIKLGSTTSMAIASACRERCIPIVFMTGYVAMDLPVECGDAPVLPKPFSTDDLLVSIRRAMAMQSA